MPKNNGGPAFPVVGENGPYGEGDFITVGMSLRDYFVAKAMCGMLAYTESWVDEIEAAIFAEKSYLLADAMLKEREE